MSGKLDEIRENVIYVQDINFPCLQLKPNVDYLVILDAFIHHPLFTNMSIQDNDEQNAKKKVTIELNSVFIIVNLSFENII